MPIYTPYFIFLALLFISLLISVIIKKNKEGLDVSSPKPIRITIGIVGLYYAVKIFFGWRFTSWYFEAFLMLCVCFALDYFVIIKNRYPKKANTLYYVVRISYIVLPPLAIIGTILFTIITFGWGARTIEYAFPLDTSHGEQRVYRNLYIYMSERASLGGGFVFKKKILFFEKDVMKIESNYWSVFGRNIEYNEPITGYISRVNDSIIYIGAYKFSEEQLPEKCIKITIVKPDFVIIKAIGPLERRIDSSVNVNL